MYVCDKRNKIFKTVLASPATTEFVNASNGIDNPQGITIFEGFLYITNQSEGPSAPASSIAKINIGATTSASSDYSWVNSDTMALSGPIGLAEYCGFLYVCNKNISTVSKINI